MTFSAAQTGAKAGVGWRYLPKRVGFAAKIETPKEVYPHDFLNAPDELDIVIYSQKDGDRLVVHLLDRDESRASLDGITLRVNGMRPIKAVYRPGGKPLAPAGCTVSLGKFDVYDMVVVEFAAKVGEY